MPIETIEFNGVEYPAIQAKGGASLWIREIANQYCDGIGLDIGYSKPEWKYPMAVGIDESLNNGYHAMNLPDSKDCDLHNEAYGWPFIHSSHCLEHVKENWYNVLDYWLTKIKVGGIIFLYLPHKSQEYWLPKNNRKHIHSFDGSEIADYLRSLGHKVMLSGVDFNHSFVVVCEKVGKNGLVKPVLNNEYERSVIRKQRNTESDNANIKMSDSYIKSVKDARERLDATVKTANMLDNQNPQIPHTITAELITPNCIWFGGKAYHL